MKKSPLKLCSWMSKYQCASSLVPILNMEGRTKKIEQGRSKATRKSRMMDRKDKKVRFESSCNQIDVASLLVSYSNLLSQQRD